MPLIYVHLMALIVWLGGMVFFSFVAAPSIFLTLGRETAGAVVGAIFPKYFMTGYVMSSTLLLTFLFICRDNLRAFKAPLVILASCAALAFVSGMVVGEKARGIKAAMYAAAEGTEKEELKNSFHQIHRVSTAINIVILILLLVYVGNLPAVIGRG